MERPGYVPERGHVVWLEFDPQAGHEQAGRRPALVVSPKAYNGRVGLAVCCPITSQIKGYPFEVPLPSLSKAGRSKAGHSRVAGAVLADQLKSLDWRARRAERFGTAPDEVLQEVLAKILVLVG